MPIVRRADTRAFELHGNHMTGVSTPGYGAEQVEMWWFRMDAGAATPVYVHDAEEVVVILAGSGLARLGEHEQAFGAGDTLILPKHVVHQIVCREAIEGVSALPIGSRVCTPTGEVMDLPGRQ